MKLFYENNFGQSIDFMGWPYMVSESDLFNYEWVYESKNSVSSKISRFHREFTEKSIKISVSAVSETDYRRAVQTLLEVTERDVLNQTPGKLWVNGEYLPCYFFKSEKSEWSPGAAFLVNTFSIVSETGFWIRETTTSFRVNGSLTPIDGKRNLDYPTDYPMDYASGMAGKALINQGFFPTDFEITIYGGCQNPEINISGHTYKVSCQLDDGEYLKINSVTKKVYKVKVNGEQVNQFHLWNRDSYIFEKIPKGYNSVTWSGLFGFDVTLLEKRSEPRWI